MQKMQAESLAQLVRMSEALGHVERQRISQPSHLARV